MRYATKKKILYLVFVIILIILLLHVDLNARKTNIFIEKRKISSVLHEETSENFTSTALVDCDYNDIIYDDTKLPLNLIDGDLSEVYRIKEGGEYAPTECKARFSTAIVVPYRFIFPYSKLFGEVTAIIANQFKNINGMSNQYFDRGGEDDDFYARLESHNLKLCRFEPETSEYHVIAPRLQRKRNARKLQSRLTEDGLSSLKYTEVATVLHPLFTHIMVDL
ncbi:unnamed protein product [Parnassius apollo]|uniref:(apollo) hypothetical protein n=1 Tax=Parnassius apollo TaxID=110799 RepID=A0A8S3W8E0_PARAO|nr:unnamed protein product [Parnassius apollo]